MKNGSLKVSKHLDGTEELVEVVRQPRLRISILCIRKQVYLRFFSLGFLRQVGIVIEETIPDEPANGRDNREEDEKPGFVGQSDILGTAR